jgi:hypothetical protein
VCYRIENLKFEHRTAEQVKNLFHSDDKPHITVRLLAPSDAGYDTDYTAIVDYHVEGEPRLDYRGYALDKTFEGFTTLNAPKQPVAAELVMLLSELSVSLSHQFPASLPSLDWLAMLSDHG